MKRNTNGGWGSSWITLPYVKYTGWNQDYVQWGELEKKVRNNIVKWILFGGEYLSVIVIRLIIKKKKIFLPFSCSVVWGTLFPTTLYLYSSITSCKVETFSQQI